MVLGVGSVIATIARLQYNTQQHMHKTFRENYDKHAKEWFLALGCTERKTRASPAASTAPPSWAEWCRNAESDISGPAAKTPVYFKEYQNHSQGGEM